MNPIAHILVVEDMDEDFETVVEAARRAGISNPLRRAISGTECLSMLQELVRNKSSWPALILLDLNTPGDNGRDALSQIKNDPKLRFIPTVVLSTSANPRDVDFCYANNANAYHIKPVNYALHLQSVQDIFGYWLSRVLLPNEQATAK